MSMRAFAGRPRSGRLPALAFCLLLVVLSGCAALDTYSPARDLYNELFRAADNKEASVDVSEFPLSISEKARTCDSLYPEGGFQFYYLKYIRLSGDGNTVNFMYTDTSQGR